MTVIERPDVGPPPTVEPIAEPAAESAWESAWEPAGEPFGESRPRSTGRLAVVAALLGFVAVLAAVVLVSDYDVVPPDAPVADLVPVVPRAPTPPAVRTYTFRVEGTAPTARVDYSLDGQAGGGDPVRVPWTTRMSTGEPGTTSSSVTAVLAPGTPGSITCTILDGSGRVVAQRTAVATGARVAVNCLG